MKISINEQIHALFMNEKLKHIHIGSIIEKKLEESSMSISEFAPHINRNRTTIYYLFRQKSIDLDLLIKISEILKYDFIHEIYFPEYLKKVPKKIQFLIEMEESEMAKFNWLQEFIRFLKSKKISFVRRNE